jgi:ankyrin repeat protein
MIAGNSKSIYAMYRLKINVSIYQGANVNAVSIPHGITPLYNACHQGNVTSLDFIEFLLEVGADPNAQDPTELTPLKYTTPFCPGAAKFLLKWPTTDADITDRSGESFLAMVRIDVKYISDRVEDPDNPDQIQDQFQLQQWREIEEILVERGSR